MNSQPLFLSFSGRSNLLALFCLDLPCLGRTPSQPRAVELRSWIMQLPVEWMNVLRTYIHIGRRRSKWNLVIGMNSNSNKALKRFEPKVICGIGNNQDRRHTYSSNACAGEQSACFYGEPFRYRTRSSYTRIYQYERQKSEANVKITPKHLL
jgi:hypothetical protein